MNYSPSQKFDIRLLPLFLIFCGCTPSMYSVVNEKSFEKISTQHDMKKMIFLSENDVTNSDQLIQLLNKKKWLEFDDKLKYVKDNTTYDFLKSVRLLLEEKYLSSFQMLNNLPESSFDCQIMILKTDCLRELGVDSIDYHRKYQEVVDCSRNEKIKTIAKTRYRFFKYGY